MAQALTRGKEQAMTVAATVTRLNFGIAEGVVQTLILESSDVDVYVVTKDVADGAALPADGRIPVPASAMPKWIDITPYGQIGIAGTGAGTTRVEGR